MYYYCTTTSTRCKVLSLSMFSLFFFTPEGLIPVNLSDSYIYLNISRSIGIIIVIII